MVELEHARELLGSMGLETAATLLDAQMERSLHAEHTYCADNPGHDKMQVPESRTK